MKGTVVALATAVSDGDIAVADTDLVRIAAVLETPFPPVAAIEQAPKTDLDFDNQINKELSVADRSKVLDTLSQFADCFAVSILDLGKTDVIELSIDRGDAQPIYQFPFSNALKERRIIRDQVAEMLKQDVIEPSTSSWSSPVRLVKKSEPGEYRFYVDYRKLKAKDVYPLAQILYLNIWTNLEIVDFDLDEKTGWGK